MDGVAFARSGNRQFTTIVVGLGLYLVLSVGLPLLSYRYAVRRYRRFVLE